MHKTYVCMYVDSAPTAVQQNGISLHCQSNQRINQATNQQTNHASKHFRKRHTKLRNKNAILTHTNKQTKEKPSKSQLNCMATLHPIRQVAYRICELLAALRKRSCWRWQAEVDALSRWHADNEPAEADVGTEVELEFAFAFWFGLSATLWPSRRIACQLASCAYCCFSFFFFLFRFFFFVFCGCCIYFATTSVEVFLHSKLVEAGTSFKCLAVYAHTQIFLFVRVSVKWKTFWAYNNSTSDSPANIYLTQNYYTYISTHCPDLFVGA